MTEKEALMNNRGMTLIEVMIALGLLVLASAAALQAIYLANIVSIEARENSIAMNDARAVLEQVKITALSSLPNNTTVSAAAIWPNLATFVSNNLNQEQIRVTGASGASLRQITVTVQWVGPRNKARQLVFTTLKSYFNG